MKGVRAGAAVLMGLLLGVALTLGLGGSPAFDLGRLARLAGAPGAAAAPATATIARIPARPTLEEAAPVATATPAAAASATPAAPTPTPTLAPVAVGPPPGEDLEDVVLLTTAGSVGSPDANFCRIGEFYGLRCRRVALDSAELTAGLLRDSRGRALPLIGISADTLLASPPWLSGAELEVLRRAVEEDGAVLLVSKVNAGHNIGLLSQLTAGAIVGVTAPRDSTRNWLISSTAPEISQEFTGQAITSTFQALQGDFGLSLAPQAPVETLISSTDNEGREYPIFVRVRQGAGSVFVDAGRQTHSLDEVPLRGVYYDDSQFSGIVPLMLAMRHALGDKAWHNDQNYANLTLDDPTLTEPWHDLGYAALLREMQSHGFHTTIAMIPRDWQRSELGVAHLFSAYPEYFSLVQQGNNAGGYEFYRYDLSQEVAPAGEALPARPLAEQQVDLAEGLSRMASHQARTGLVADRVMVFPRGICPEPTLVLLKQYNYLATVNAQYIPLDASAPAAWDYGMRAAGLEYAGFPLLARRQPGSYAPFRPMLQPFILDLFVDKPALFYAQAGQLFGEGLDAFNPVADRINALAGGVRWSSLGEILRHLYAVKTADDGSLDVRLYSPRVTIANESSVDRTFHLSRPETLDVPIRSLTVNGHEFSYRVEDGLLALDLQVPAGAAVDVDIVYGEK